MSSVNKVILVGRLGKDPEKNGPAVKFSIATSDSWVDKQGQKQTRTEWHNITTFGKLAEICEKYLKKGSEVYVEGKLRTDNYDKNGVKTYTTFVVAETVQFLGGGSGGGQNTGGNYETDSSDIPF